MLIKGDDLLALALGQDERGVQKPGFAAEGDGKPRRCLLIGEHRVTESLKLSALVNG